MRLEEKPRPRTIGRAEQAVMDCLWKEGPATAEQIRQSIGERWPMKDSTIRTVLLRLERKGFVTHAVQGRSFIYKAKEPPASIAVRAAKHIIDQFCGGSAEQLVLGLVDQKVVSPARLKRLLARIDAAAKNKGQA